MKGDIKPHHQTSQTWTSHALSTADFVHLGLDFRVIYVAIDKNGDNIVIILSDGLPTTTTPHLGFAICWNSALSLWGALLKGILLRWLPGQSPLIPFLSVHGGKSGDRRN